MMPANADNTTYGAIRAAPVTPSHPSLPVADQTSASRTGQGIDIAVAARACDATIREPARSSSQHRWQRANR